MSQLIEAEFDIDFYLKEYPDLVLSPAQALPHFWQIGWIEGRNPNPYFDTVTYLKAYGDVAASGVNPFAHYLRFGVQEGRQIFPSVTPSARSSILFGYTVADWVSRLRPVVDIPYYLTRVPALPDDVDPVAHFAFRGWRDGYDASASVLTVAAALLDARAVSLLVNPVLAQVEIEAGRYRPTAGQRKVKPSVVSVRKVDRGHKLLLEFDRAYYVAAYRDVADAGVDPLDHYLDTGWRELRNPTGWFDTGHYLRTYADVREAGLNPFWHYLVIGRSEDRETQARPKADKTPVSPQAPKNPDRTPVAAAHSAEAALVATEFSADYYLSSYTDVAASGIDPLSHFMEAGWREGRNPNRSFDTAYYLQASEDVRAANVNPFWHYLAAGRAEGRAAVRPGGYRRKILEAAREPEARSGSYIAVEGKMLTARALSKLIGSAVQDCRGVAVAVSHDCYTRVVGGTQIFIADEERRFRTERYAYVQISPRRPLLSLAQPSAGFEVQLVVNGEFAGLCRMDMLAAAIGTIVKARKLRSLLAIHSLLGFDPDDIVTLHRKIAAERTFFWLHDYTSLCEGFNLLRNDIAFCHAPSADSIACRVCVYGAGRQGHLDRMGRFFEAVPVDVVAPSHFTLDLWEQRASLRRRSAIAHPHWALEPLPRTDERQPRRPVSIAFIGYPASAKGWEMFEALVDANAGQKRYRFYHFAVDGTRSHPDCTFVPTAVTPADRMAAKRNLEERRIDYVAMLAPWPETFSYVAHEAVAAGSRLICLADSGNVAALAQRLDCGRVFHDFAALAGYVGSGQAHADGLRARAKRQAYAVDVCGTTATLEGLFEAA